MAPTIVYNIICLLYIVSYYTILYFTYYIILNYYYVILYSLIYSTSQQFFLYNLQKRQYVIDDYKVKSSLTRSHLAIVPLPHWLNFFFKYIYILLYVSVYTQHGQDVFKWWVLWFSGRDRVESLSIFIPHYIMELFVLQR